MIVSCALIFKTTLKCVLEYHAVNFLFSVLLNNSGKIQHDEACHMLFMTLLASVRDELTKMTKSQMINSFNYLIYWKFHSHKSVVTSWLTILLDEMQTSFHIGPLFLVEVVTELFK